MAVGKKPIDRGELVAKVVGGAVGLALIPVALFIVEFGRGRGWW